MIRAMNPENRAKDTPLQSVVDPVIHVLLKGNCQRCMVSVWNYLTSLSTSLRACCDLCIYSIMKF